MTRVRVHRRQVPIRKWPAALLATLVLIGPVVAGPSSASYEIKADVFHAGGQPPAGTSASFRVTLGILGEGLAALALDSASYGVGAGFSVGFPPPGEVTGVVFTDPNLLAWDVEPSARAYNLYRDSLTSIAPGFGACEQSVLPGEAATDMDVPAIGTGFFYLVTAKNLLDEEGTKGFQSNGAERANAAPCP
jgi:hypothetical protein